MNPAAEPEAVAELPKVVHLTSVHDALDVRIFHKECRSLAAAGYKVVLVAPHDRSQVRDGVRIRAVGKPGGRLRRMLFTSWVVFFFGLWARGRIYHLHDPGMLGFGVLLKLLGRIVIYDAHENLPKEISSKHDRPGWQRALVAAAADLIERTACASFDGVVTVTPEIARRFAAAKAVVVRNYPLLEEFAPEEASPYAGRDPVAVYLGGLSEIRGVREMVHAVGQLERPLGVRLWLAGRFDPPELEQSLSSEPGWSRTKALGWQSREQVASMLQRARIGMLVLHPVPSHLETLPIELFEYMAAGLPVVASNFPSWRVVLGGAGVLVDPLDPAAIAERIRWLVAHPGEAEEMGRLGREAVVREYNWENEVGKLLMLYRTVVGD